MRVTGRAIVMTLLLALLAACSGGGETVARTCGFHDHLQEQHPDLRGRIIIQ